ncbi:MAG: flagellar filament capping protein FliD [Terriglobales bacterium]|jgi:flagellar hook-associated protein 2
MSSVNLSSILTALGSSSSGIDVESAVEQALSAESGPLTGWANQQSTLQTQTSDINSIESDITTLENSLQALSNPAGVMSSMTATSSDSNIVSASAAAGTDAGTHVIEVNNLATSDSWYSTDVASSTTDLAAGTFNIQVGSNTPITVATGSGVNTLSDVANYINAQNAGVSASVVTDASGARLALVSTSSGAANNFTVSSGSGLTFTEATKGKDASLTVDGIPIDSASNTVTGAVNGLTLNLAGASTGTQVSVTVAPDETDVSQAVQAFVSAYNTVIGDVNTQYTVSSSNEEGPLAGDPAISSLQSMLLGVGSYSTSGGTVSTLADLGISMNNDGTLTVDDSQLSNAIQNNYGAVQTFLQGTSSNGFASTLNTQLKTLTDSVSGAFTVDLQSISAENTDLQGQINNFETYLTSQQTYLTNEYNKADIALQELPIEEKQLDAELGISSSSSSS